MLNFGGLVWGGTSHFGTPKFSQILSFFYIYLPWKFHVSSLQSLNFGGLVWGSPILVSLNFIFPLCLVTLKISRVQLKKFEFWWASFGKNPHIGTPNFRYVWFMFSVYLFQKFDHLALTIKKFQILVATFQGNSRFWYPQILLDFIFSFMFAYSENFMWLT